MSLPRVSYVVPAYRPRPDWLRQAVVSMLAQGGSEAEVVVVDDGSPDPVAAPVQDERVQVIRVPHGGVSRAREAGVAASTAPHVRFFDADDVVPPGSTARLLAHLGGREDVIAYGASLNCDEQLRPIWAMRTTIQGDVRRACLVGAFPVRPGSLLYPRGVLEHTGAWNPHLTVSEDWEYFLRALDHATVRGDGAVVHWYRRHGASATGDEEAGRRGARAVVDGYFERHPEQRGTSLERRAHARLDATAARVLATRGRFREAAASGLAALRADPVALLQEALQTPPAIVGRVRHRVRPASPLEPPW